MSILLRFHGFPGCGGSEGKVSAEDIEATEAIKESDVTEVTEGLMSILRPWGQHAANLVYQRCILPRFLMTKVPVSEVPVDRGSSLPGFLSTGVPFYRLSRLPRFHSTKVPVYKGHGDQCSSLSRFQSTEISIY